MIWYDYNYFCIESNLCSKYRDNKFMVLCLLYANLIYFLLNTEAPKWASSMYLTNSPFKPSSIIKMSTQSLYRVVPKQFILKDNLLLMTVFYLSRLIIIIKKDVVACNDGLGFVSKKILTCKDRRLRDDF